VLKTDYLGMMIVGMGILSKMRGWRAILRFKLAWLFLASSSPGRLLAFGFLVSIVGFCRYKILAVKPSDFSYTSITPIAANTVVIATLLDTSPDKVAATTRCSVPFCCLAVHPSEFLGLGPLSFSFLPRVLRCECAAYRPSG